ncbi:MAG: glutathione S-transferase N-terminal domain-containing protein, partial [Polyangiaceae bacterium]
MGPQGTPLSRNRTLDVATSFLVSGFRFAAGQYVRGNSRRPPKLLELYEFEACPFCRKAREALCELELDAIIYPCPKNGRFRDQVKKRGGKMMFPFLIDPNTGKEMYESDDIIRYLATTYANGEISWTLKMGPLTTLSSSLASAVRMSRGLTARRARAPEELLELWSFEASPYCRLVREALCELEIPYVLHNVPKKGATREAFIARSGKNEGPVFGRPEHRQRNVRVSRDRPLLGRHLCARKITSSNIVNSAGFAFDLRPGAPEHLRSRVPVLRQFLDRIVLAGISRGFIRTV